MAESERGGIDDDLRRQFAAMPADGPCLDDTTWERMAGQEMTAFERERALDHVTTCAACGTVYQALRTLETDARPFDPHLPAAPLGTPSSRESPGTIRSWFEVPRLAAAVLALVTIGALAWWNVSLRRANAQLETTLARAAGARPAVAPASDDGQVADLRRRLAEASAPQVNVPLVSLEPDALRGEPGVATVVLPPDVTLLTIVLNTADDREYQDYGLTILDGGGAIVWSARGLRKSARNTFTLSVPRDILPIGEHRLELAGLRDGRPGAVQIYRVRVTER